MAQRYGVVDTDYILKNLPEYAQAKSQVDQLSTQWAGEVSALQSELQSLKDALAAEQILLSPEKLDPDCPHFSRGCFGLCLLVLSVRLVLCCDHGRGHCRVHWLYGAVYRVEK